MSNVFVRIPTTTTCGSLSVGRSVCLSASLSVCPSISLSTYDGLCHASTGRMLAPSLKNDPSFSCPRSTTCCCLSLCPSIRLSVCLPVVVCVMHVYLSWILSCLCTCHGFCHATTDTMLVPSLKNDPSRSCPKTTCCLTFCSSVCQSVYL